MYSYHIWWRRTKRIKNKKYKNDVHHRVMSHDSAKEDLKRLERKLQRVKRTIHADIFHYIHITFFLRFNIILSFFLHFTFSSIPARFNIFWTFYIWWFFSFLFGHFCFSSWLNKMSPHVSNQFWKFVVSWFHLWNELSLPLNWSTYSHVCIWIPSTSMLSTAIWSF